MAPRSPSPQWQERRRGEISNIIGLGLDDALIWFRFKKLYYLYLLRRRKLPAVIRDHLQACLSLDLKKPNQRPISSSSIRKPRD